MASISITIPDAQLIRVVNGICLHFGYQSILIDGSANAESKGQFAKRMVATIVKSWLKETEGNIAADVSRKAATDDVESIIIT